MGQGTLWRLFGMVHVRDGWGMSMNGVCRCDVAHGGGMWEMVSVDEDWCH